MCAVASPHLCWSHAQANCYRSPHNYHVFTPPGGAREAWVSIDNDRCFVDRRYYHHHDHHDLGGCAAVRGARGPAWRAHMAGGRSNSTTGRALVGAFLRETSRDELAHELHAFLRPSTGGLTGGLTGGPSLIEQLEERLDALLERARACAYSPELVELPTNK